MIDIENFPKMQQEKEIELSRLEPYGIVLEYILCGAPLVCGCLYLITDKDIDSYSKMMLESVEREQKTNVISCMMRGKE